MIDLQSIEVRRSNGVCEFGEWLAADHEDVPALVGEAVADEIVEHDLDDGYVTVGGQEWAWRKA